MNLLGRRRADGNGPEPDIVVIAKDGSVGTTDGSDLPGLLQRRLTWRRKRNSLALAGIFGGTFTLLVLAHVISGYANLSARMDLAEATFILLSCGFGAIPRTLFAEQLRTDRRQFAKMSLLCWGVYLLAARLAFSWVLPELRNPLNPGLVFFFVYAAALGFRYLLRGGQW